MPSMIEICRDLRAEHAVLDELVAPLGDRAWETQTPAEGWTITDQISHLAYFDDKALLAATQPERFRAWRDSRATGELTRTDRAPADVALGRFLHFDELLEMWRAGRAQMVVA